MPRSYVACADDLPLPRGRLDVTRQFTKFAASPQKLACRYDALTEEIELNRIMKAVVVRLSGVARSPDNRRMLRELGFAYTQVSDVPIALLRWHMALIDRRRPAGSSVSTSRTCCSASAFRTTSMER